MTEEKEPDIQVRNQDEDLVDLEPDKESIMKRLIAPKVIILTFLSLIFISKNIYNIFVIGTPEPAAPPPEVDDPSKQDDSVMERMYGYFILTVALFVVYLLCVRANDRALLKQIEE